MYALSTVLFALLSVAAVHGLTGCPNGGTGIGLQQFCQIGTHTGGPVCSATVGTISKDGTCDYSAQKTANTYSDLCGGGYTYGASVGCDSSGKIISVNPPGEGKATTCTPVDIDCGEPFAYYSIAFCCH